MVDRPRTDRPARFSNHKIENDKIESFWMEFPSGRSATNSQKGMTPPPWPHPLQLIVALSVASLSFAMTSGAPVPPIIA